MRAQRKRIVLSNPNALSVPGLQKLTADNAIASEEGAVLTFDNESIDSLRAAEAFKHTQGWNLFHQPSTLVTSQTKALAEMVRGVKESKGTHREILVGDKLSGKSVLSLQSMAFALQEGWVVIHIPEGKFVKVAKYVYGLTMFPAQEVTQGHTSYAPVRTPQGATIYTQPEYTAALLSRISKANATVLSKLTLSRQHQLPIPIQSNISLARFAELGASDPVIAPAMFSALLSELCTESTEAHPRPPLLFSVDGAPFIFRHTGYLDSEANPVHAFDLSLIKSFIALLRGATQLPNGGIVQAVDSNSNRPTVRALDAHIQRELERSRGSTAFSKVAGSMPFLSPYHDFDARVSQALHGVKVRDVPGISKLEARGVMEYYARSGVLRGEISEGMVGEAWTLSGGGIMGELESSVTRLRV